MTAAKFGHLYLKSTLDGPFKEGVEAGGTESLLDSDQDNVETWLKLGACSVLGSAAWHVPLCVPTIAAASEEW